MLSNLQLDTRLRPGCHAGPRTCRPLEPGAPPPPAASTSPTYHLPSSMNTPCELLGLQDLLARPAHHLPPSALSFPSAMWHVIKAKRGKENFRCQRGEKDAMWRVPEGHACDCGSAGHGHGNHPRNAVPSCKRAGPSVGGPWQLALSLL